VQQTETTAPPIWLRWRLWLFAVIFAGVLWRIIDYLLCFPVWGDEASLGVNILRKSYVQLTGPLQIDQVCPIGFLWLSKLLFNTFGTSPMVLRFVPLMAGICAIFLTWPVARHFSGKRVALLATALVACSLETARYSTDFKPYSIDFLTSLCLVELGLSAIRKPADWRALLGLILICVPAIAFSYPSIFVLASVGLSLLPGMILKAGRRERILYCVFGILSIAAFVIIFFTISRTQMNAAHTAMEQYWRESFPPRNIGVLWWLIEVHFSNMMNYPLGGGAGTAFIITPLCVLGAWRLAIKRRFAVLALLAGPFILTFIAAIFHLYPYGFKGRVEQHLVPSIALLWALGVVTLVAWFVRNSRSMWVRRNPIWIWRAAISWICAGFVVFVLVCIPLDFKHPYISPGPQIVRNLVNAVFKNAGPDTQIVIDEKPYKYASEIQWNLITQRHPYRTDGKFDAAGLKIAGDLWVMDFGYSFNKNLEQQTLAAAQKMDLHLYVADRLNYTIRVGYYLNPPVYAQAIHFLPQAPLSLNQTAH